MIYLQRRVVCQRLLLVWYDDRRSHTPLPAVGDLVELTHPRNMDTNNTMLHRECRHLSDTLRYARARLKCKCSNDLHPTWVSWGRKKEHFLGQGPVRNRLIIWLKNQDFESNPADSCMLRIRLIRGQALLELPNVYTHTTTALPLVQQYVLPCADHRRTATAISRYMSAATKSVLVPFFPIYQTCDPRERYTKFLNVRLLAVHLRFVPPIAQTQPARVALGKPSHHSTLGSYFGLSACP